MISYPYTSMCLYLILSLSDTIFLENDFLCIFYGYGFVYHKKELIFVKEYIIYPLLNLYPL